MDTPQGRVRRVTDLYRAAVSKDFADAIEITYPSREGVFKEAAFTADLLALLDMTEGKAPCAT